jgi:hypothetical protein
MRFKNYYTKWKQKVYIRLWVFLFRLISVLYFHVYFSKVILLYILHLLVSVLFGFLYEYFHKIWHAHRVCPTHHLVHLSCYLFRLVIERENLLPPAVFLSIAGIILVVDLLFFFFWFWLSNPSTYHLCWGLALLNRLLRCSHACLIRAGNSSRWASRLWRQFIIFRTNNSIACLCCRSHRTPIRGQ